MIPAAKAIQLTKEGLEELQAELDELKNQELPAIIKRVAIARAHGDLSENAEYTNAKEDQHFIETRISEIEDILERAVVVKQTTSQTKVGIGSTVVTYLKDKNKKHFTFHVVGEFEADPTEGKISAVSPLGKALMGKGKNDEVVVTAPAGEVTYIIHEIS